MSTPDFNEKLELGGDIIDFEGDLRPGGRDKILSALTEAYTRGKRDTEKAFGGCTKCYGKGYATQMAQLIGTEDFGGDGFTETPKVHINFCSCDRGKVLAALRSK